MSAIQRPVQIEEFTIALRDTTDEQLQVIKQELLRSIAKLTRTNNRLKKLAGEELTKEEKENITDNEEDEEYYQISKEDTSLFKDIINENGIVARNQASRITAIEDELTFRGIKFEKYDYAN